MLQAEHLSYNITEEGRQSEILTDVSFTVEDGEMLVITGPNGGGKSTLAKLLMGINEATGGKIILDGQDITSYTIDKRAQAGMGFAFQQPPRFKGLTVRRLLSLAHGSELPEDAMAQLAVYDRYSWEYTAFPVGGAVILIEDDRLAEALNALPQNNRDIFLMYWFLDMADREIAEYMNMARRTVNTRRQKAYRLLKELMGGEADD